MDNWWGSIWFKGSHLPHPDDAADEYWEVDESVMAEGSGTVDESEIVESADADSEESKEIVKTTMAKKNILTVLSMLILAVIPIAMLIKIFD